MRPRQWLFAAAILFTIYALTLPFAFVTDWSTVREHWGEAIQRSALSQFDTLSKADLLQNVLLFVPIGLLGFLTCTTTRRIAAFVGAVLAAVVISATCELLQLFTVDRVTSVWDVWANAAGATVGATLGLVGGPALRRARGLMPRFGHERRLVFLVFCAAALVAVAATEPFDITLDVGTVWQNVKPLLAGGFYAIHPISDEMLTAVRFAILSFLVSRWLRPRVGAERTSRVLAATACAAIAVALEGVQMLIASRSPALQDVIAGALGAVVGAAAGPPLLRALPAPVLVVAATAIAAVPSYLQPYDVARTYSSIAVVPFLAYYQFTSLQTVSHVTELMLIYAPVGFAIAWSQRSASLTRPLLAVAVMAGTLEYAQGWIVGRYPDVTDFGVALLGGLAGAALAQRGAVQISESPP